MLHLFQFWSDSSFATQHPISIAPQYKCRHLIAHSYKYV